MSTTILNCEKEVFEPFESTFENARKRYNLSYLYKNRRQNDNWTAVFPGTPF